MQVTTVNTEQIKYYHSWQAYEMDSSDLRAAIESGEPIVLVDGRASGVYAEGHIPDAINLPQREINAGTTASLNRSKLYVCYCEGIGRNA